VTLQSRKMPRGDDAQRWMGEYAAICRDYELSDLRLARLAPLVMRPSVEQALMVCLFELGSRTHLRPLQAKLDERFPGLHVTAFAAMGRTRGGVTYGDDGYVLTAEGERRARAYLAVERRFQ